jgi:hypothetical protein
MSRLLIALFVAAGLGIAGSAAAQTPAPTTASPPISKDSYTVANENAEGQYVVDKGACSSLNGNAKDICAAEAKGKYNVAKAEAEAAHDNTPKARENARIVHAQANHDVAIQKCDDLAGNRKDVCVKEAQAEFVKAKAHANVDRVVIDTQKDAATKQADARKDANEDKRDAEYKVAIAKCQALEGAAKDACFSSARVQYGKS